MREDEVITEVQEIKRATEARRILEGQARGFQALGKDCRGAAVYYPGEILPIDGNPKNRAFGNLAMVCPRCSAHILLSRYSPEDIWLLKARGLSYAKIGSFLGLSRERVRQLCKKHEARQRTESTTLIEADLDELVKRAERAEDDLLASGRLKKRIDKRTKKKRIIAELGKLRTKEVQNER